MRLWLNRTGEVSLREQLVTQVKLGVLCRELSPGERLPSTRELARRFGIHANTASAAYRELEHEGWLEFRHGSGVYVRKSRPTATSLESPVEFAIDSLIGDLMARARKLGATQAMVHARLRCWQQMEPPARWLVIEPEAELQRIVMAEMEQMLALPVTGCTPADCARDGVLNGVMAVVLPSKAATVRKLLPAGTDLTVLEVHPVSPELQDHLQRYMPAHAGELVGIASRWAEFQRVARTMLIAAGLAPESLLVRDAAKSGWKRGLDATSGVVCDVVTALELPKGCHAMVFRLLGEKALTGLVAVEARLSGESGTLEL